MSDLKITIEGDEPENARERAPTAPADDVTASRERTRAAIGERNRWLNEATAAKADLAAFRMQTIDTLSNAEAEAAKRALEWAISTITPRGWRKLPS
jgi:hypothetical protein